MRRILILGACLFSTACASHLKVWNASNADVKGVPFRATEIYVKTGWYKARADGVDCADARFVETVAVATSQYFANVAPAQLAKSEFALKFAENGSTLSEISLNSTPAASDAITAVTDLVGKVAPILAPTVVAPSQPDVAAPLFAKEEAPQAKPKPACDTGPVKVHFTPFAEWNGAAPE